MAKITASFIGLGAQKCASTWLYTILKQMPEVCVSDDKELDFFSYFFDRGYEWYGRHFVGTPGTRHRGELSPSYLVDGDAPSRAQAYNPDLRILVTLRDPVARAFSNHLHEVRQQHVSGENLRFETALDNNPLYREQGFYARHLSRWMAHFPADRFLILFQEEILAAPAEAADSVADFLGVARLSDFVARRENESVIYRNAIIGRTFYRFGDVARRNGLGKAIERVKKLPVVQQLHAANRQSVRDIVPAMEAETERALTDLYAQDVADLTRLLGRETPWPRYEGITRAALAS